MTINSFPPTQSSTKRKLTIQQCSSCATLLAPSVAECSRCHGNRLAQVDSDGFGFIVSSKIVEREVGRAADVLAPQTIAIVELDDGPWVYSWVTGAVPSLSDGRVRVEFTSAPTREQLPVFAVTRSL